ncbi:MAG: hypothetical protein K9I69_03115 [Ignavibacteriales bacterium]|nr:hypothetical protein [Ignavibacteriales bacterium]MCF8307006.1 hypothetical protein [Ignavibacteriales bacterium]MCF8438220.1 hypothetical protein [Ignavibacteriales bacterium]
MKSKSSRRIYPKKIYYFIMVLLPLLFIGLIEGGLRIFEYGKDYSLFMKIDNFPGKTFLNPEITRKYFQGVSNLPSVIPDAFDTDKREGAFRIFVLGGSTTAGFPYPPNISFPRHIKRKLGELFPDKRIEVINTGISAIGTFVITDILDEIISADPDLVLIYSGHNEFYGVFGAGSTTRISSSPWLIRLHLNFKDFRLYQLIENIVFSAAEFTSFPAGKQQNTLMAEMISDAEIGLNSDTYNDVSAYYRENLERMIRKLKAEKIPVIIGELVSNLQLPPMDKRGGRAKELYKAGMQKYRERNFFEADSLLQKAGDSDEVRFRAPTDFNNIIRETASEFSIPVAATQAIFKKSSSSGICDGEFFTDHVHPDITGNQLLAEAFLTAMKNSGYMPDDSFSAPQETQAANYLELNPSYSPLDSVFASYRLQFILNSYPFTSDKTARLDPSSLQRKNIVDSTAFDIITGKIGWETGHLYLTDHFLKHGLLSSAAREVYVLSEDKPFDKFAIMKYIPALLEKGELTISKDILQRNYRNEPDEFNRRNLTRISLKQGEFKSANIYLEEIVRHGAATPEDHFMLSKIAFSKGDLRSAADQIKTCLSLNPNFPGARKILETIEKFILRNNTK